MKAIFDLTFGLLFMKGFFFQGRRKYSNALENFCGAHVERNRENHWRVNILEIRETSSTPANALVGKEKFRKSQPRSITIRVLVATALDSSITGIYYPMTNQNLINSQMITLRTEVVTKLNLSQVWLITYYHLEWKDVVQRRFNLLDLHYLVLWWKELETTDNNVSRLYVDKKFKCNEIIL